MCCTKTCYTVPIVVIVGSVRNNSTMPRGGNPRPNVRSLEELEAARAQLAAQRALRVAALAPSTVQVPRVDMLRITQPATLGVANVLMSHVSQALQRALESPRLISGMTTVGKQILRRLEFVFQSSSAYYVTNCGEAF